MVERIIIAGSGGQGIMLLGKVLSQAALIENKHLTWLPAYGAEVRGGTAYCMVTISDQEISSPFIEQADTLIAMNEPSLRKFKSRIKNKGLLLINSSLVHTMYDVRCTMYELPFTQIATKLGNIKVANMVALGAYLAKSKTIKLNSVLRAISKIAPKNKKGLIPVNKKAIYVGIKL